MANVFDVAKYILTISGPISTMKLQKLCYYCQAWSLVWDDKALFNEDFYAWENGPICKELFFRTQGKFLVSSTDEPGDCLVLTLKQKRTIKSVLDFYGKKDAQWLSQLTHLEDPWKNARNRKIHCVKPFDLITKDSMAMYYGSL